MSIAPDIASGESQGTDDLVLRTGVLGLDEILCGGIRLPHKQKTTKQDACGYPSVVITGGPGCGKTTLAMSISSQSVQDGYSVLYVCTEEFPRDISEQNERYRAENDYKVLYCREKSLSQMRQYLNGLEAGVPVFFISYCPAAIDQSAFAGNPIGAHITSTVAKIQQLVLEGRVAPLRHLTVDPLFEDCSRSRWFANSPVQQRSFFKGLCELGTAYECVVLLVIERTVPSVKLPVADWHAFVADIVFVLEWGEVEDGVSRRLLTVLKSRYQPSWQGSHIVEIEDGKGLSLFINRFELSRQLSRQAATKQRSSNSSSVALTCSAQFNARFDGVVKLNGTFGLIPKGSSVLLYGQEQTRKNLVATRFLQQATLDSPHSRTLLIACGKSRQVAMSVTANYADSLAGNKDAFLRSVVIEPGPMAGELPDEFVNRIYRLLGSHNIERAVVDDEAAIYRSPEIVHYLRQLFTTRGVTALFVRTMPANTHHDEREFYDTVVNSHHVEAPGGRQIIVYSVLKRRGVAGERDGSFELRYVTQTGELRAIDSMHYMQETEGHVEHQSIALRLRAQTNPAKRYLTHFMEECLSPFFAKRRNVLRAYNDSDFDLVLRSIRNWPAGITMEVTQIANLDESWITTLKALGALADLSEYYSQENLTEIKSRYHPYVWEKLPKNESTGVPLAFPQHLDFGIYTINRDVMRGIVGSAPKGEALHDELAGIEQKILSRQEVSWDDIVTLSHALADAKKRSDFPNWHSIEFLSNRSEESVLCFVLEILWPFIFTKSACGWEFLGFSNRVGLASLRKLCLVLRDLHPFPWLLDDGGGEGEKAPLTALVQRHWYTSFSQMDEKSRERLLVIRPPSLGVDDGSKCAISMRGDTLIGVFRGALGNHWVKPILSALIEEEPTWALSLRGAGVPPMSSLITRDVLSVSAEGLDIASLYQDTCTRNDFPAYLEIKTFLASGVRRLVKAVRDSTADINAISEAVSKEFDDRIKIEVRQSVINRTS